MKIVLAFFFHLQETGGVEHVLVNFANEMVKKNHDVTILYASPTMDSPKFLLNPNVRLSNLMKDSFFPTSSKSFYKSIPFIQRLIRKFLTCLKSSYRKDWNFYCMNGMAGRAVRHSIISLNPDIIVSFNTITNALIMKNVRGIPVVTMFHIMPNIDIEQNASVYEKKILTSNAAVQVLLHHDVFYMRAISPEMNISVIPNAVIQPTYHINYGKKKVYHIVEVARLHRVDKRQHVLLEAFSKIAKEYPQWHLDFWGKESSIGYEDYLRKKIREKGLQKQVFLHGVTQDINHIYLSSDIFCFPSLREGFGLAMAEAMSYGLPVIAMKDCVAAQEIFNQKECGILVEDDIDALATAIKKLMDDPGLREKYGTIGRQVVKKYKPDTIWKQWENLLKKCIEKRDII